MPWDFTNIPDQSSRIAIVTGANTGIGYVTARELAARGAAVTLACRNLDKGQQALQELKREVPGATVELMALDLASLDSIRKFAEAFSGRHQSLDLLINNAGVMIPPRGETLDGFETQFGVNHLGHFALTGHLLPLIQDVPGSRIVTVSSLAHRSGWIRFNNLQSEKRYIRWEAYSQSKLANLLFTLELQCRLSRAGSPTLALASHPGGTRTELTRHSLSAKMIATLFLQPRDMGALPTLRAATDPQAQGGEYYGPQHLLGIRGYPVVETPSRRARDAGTAKALWAVSEDLTGIRYLDNP